MTDLKEGELISGGPSTDMIAYTMQNYQYSQDRVRDFQDEGDDTSAALASQDVVYWEVGLKAAGAADTNAALPIDDPFLAGQPALQAIMVEEMEKAQVTFAKMTEEGLPNFEPVGEYPG